MKTMPNIAVTYASGGSVAFVEFCAAPGNVLDRELIGSLRNALAEQAAEPSLKLIVLRGAGDHFSFGASVPEHMPGEVDALLPEFHELLREIDRLPLPPVMAAVRGQCLGGGFELALACDLIAVEEGARLGCPEIKLGVFPPAGCALLPLRVPAGKAARLLLTGGLLRGAEAADAGIADLLAPDGGLLEHIGAWAAENVEPLSAAALRQTRKAARWPWRDALERVLSELEKQYLSELMTTHDALEGLVAFTEKRPAEWQNR